MQINSINPNYTNTKLNNRRSERVQKTTTFETAELSGCKAGRAILAQNNISFRNLARPVEVTHLYNKKTEGKDHLDLPNIHVYEFPDTNLKAFVNIDKAGNLTESQLLFTLRNNNISNNSVLLNNLLYQVLNNKIHKENADTLFIKTDNSFAYVSNLNNKNSDLNKFLFRTDYNEDDLIKAKEELLKYLHSDTYKYTTSDIKSLYSITALQDVTNVEREINNVTLEQLQDYHKSFIQESVAEANLVIKQADVNKLNDILANINRNINIRLNKKLDSSDNKILLNNTTKIIPDNNIRADAEFHYSYMLEDAKDEIISNILSNIILLSPMFKSNEYYSSNDGYYDSLVELKRDFNQQAPVLFYNFEFYDKETSVNNLIQKFQNNITELYNSELLSEINKWKDVYKADIEYDLLENKNGLRRLLTMSEWGDDMFNIYENIESITESDVKNHINKYLINQRPFVHVRSEETLS